MALIVHPSALLALLLLLRQFVEDQLYRLLKERLVWALLLMAALVLQLKLPDEQLIGLRTAFAVKLVQLIFLLGTDSRVLGKLQLRLRYFMFR